jgi:dihydroneopterin triphosphate diphosphatase
VVWVAAAILQGVAAALKIPESVLVVIHNAQGEVLLLKRADMPDAWQSVTGSKDDWDEPWAQTAIREVFEETGIAATASDCVLRDTLRENQYPIYEQWRHRYASGTTHNTERVFTLQVPRDVSVRLSPSEHLDFVWLPFEQAAQRCFSASNAAAIRHGFARV